MIVTTTIWVITTKGIPTVKLRFFVLCRKCFIPNQIPILPPSQARTNNVFSGMRLLFRFARLLSIVITAYDTTVIMVKYRNRIIVNITSPSSSKIITDVMFSIIQKNGISKETFSPFKTPFKSILFAFISHLSFA